MAAPSDSHSAGGLDAIFADPAFWVLACLVVFLGFVARLGVPARMIASLDERGKKIDAELEQARQLREEAQKILAEAERDQIEAETSAEQIIESARNDNRRVTEAARKDLAETLRRRTAQAEQNIAAAEREATQRLRQELTDLACRTAAIALTNTADDRRLEDDVADACARLR